MKRAESILWIIFLIWSAVGMAVLGLGIDAAWVEDQFEEGALRSFFLAVEKIGDAAWMGLAALLLLVRTARSSGWKTSLTAFGLVAILSGIVEAIGAATGFPFGPYEYTERFGPLLFGLLPLAIPLAWWVVIEGSRALAAAVNLSGWKAMACAVTAALVTDFNLEPVAWKIRGYWTWYPAVDAPPAHPPIANYVAWGVVAAVLIALCTKTGVTRNRPWASAAVLVLVNLFFLVARLGG